MTKVNWLTAESQIALLEEALKRFQEQVVGNILIARATAAREARAATLEEAARWHDGLAARYRKPPAGFPLDRADILAGEHEASAAAIRALIAARPGDSNG